MDYYLAECIREPMGNHGLEGYTLGKTYHFQFKPKAPKDKRMYFRVFPTMDGSNYYETCGQNIFKRYFKPISNEVARCCK